MSMQRLSLAASAPICTEEIPALAICRHCAACCSWQIEHTQGITAGEDGQGYESSESACLGIDLFCKRELRRQGDLCWKGSLMNEPGMGQLRGLCWGCAGHTFHHVCSQAHGVRQRLLASPYPSSSNSSCVLCLCFEG